MDENKELIGIVVPSYRENSFKQFVKGWTNTNLWYSKKNIIKNDGQSGDIVNFYLIEDNETKTFNIPVEFKRMFNDFKHYSHKEIKQQLDKDGWIIPFNTDCVRSYGYYKAWQNNPDMILTLDDDTKPEKPGHIQQHYKNLITVVDQSPFYYSTLKNLPPRGLIKGESNIMISHGGWLKVPDLSAEEQLKRLSQTTNVDKNYFNEGIVPKDTFFSMCGMNVAWKPELTKYMYFGLQNLEKYGIDRCGDIWAGFYAKKRMEENYPDGVAYTGEPYVIHDRASNIWNNMKKEKNAENYTKAFIHGFVLKTCDVKDEYFLKLKQAYEIWEKLFVMTREH
jgi:hypothetical protein